MYKIRAIQKVECYSAVRRNEALTFDATWINLENAALSEKSVTKEHIWYDPTDAKEPEQSNP